MLKIENLSFSYLKDKELIKDINLEFDYGNSYILIGKNGSGKSTLLKLLVGLIKPKGGNIILDDEILNQKNSLELSKMISYVPQNIVEFKLTVYDFILSGLLSDFLFYPRKKDKEKTLDIIKEMGLLDLINTNMDMLSGGERQKCYIARALVKEPKLIVFDEPTASLDILAEKQILELVTNIIKKKNIILIIAIHDLNLALRFGDFFIFLKEGKIIHECNKNEINSKIISDSFGVDVDIKNIDNDIFISYK